MMYLPGNKDVIEPPHKCRCLKCNRPLPTGIAHFVIDSEGKEDQLCKYNGLIDDQMNKVKAWSAIAEKFQVANSVEGIEFKENQARYDKWRKAKYSQGPLR